MVQMENRMFYPYNQVTQEVERQEKRQQHPRTLHSVRKLPAKPWRRAEQSIPPRVYHVEPLGFRELVQSLTGAPPARRPRDAAPPPALDLAPVMATPEQQVAQPWTAPGEHGPSAEAIETKVAFPVCDSPELLLGLLPPSMMTAYTFPILSPDRRKAWFPDP